MACFIVPVAEAVVTSVATRILESKEKKSGNENKVHFSSKLKWLSNLLWGGSSLLAFEHLWHGEIKPFFPFLTAMENADSFSAMIHEMSTVGVGMSLMVTVAWTGMLAVSKVAENNYQVAKESEQL